MESTYSENWHRVAGLRPRLRSHVQVRRHRYRGERAYVLFNPLSGASHRLDTRGYAIVGLMDGTRTLAEVWAAASRSLGDDVPSQGEVVRLLGQLHAADLLMSDVPVDAVELERRSGRRRRAKLIQRFGNPLALRIPLFDPERFLGQLLPWTRWLFGPLGAAVWLATVGAAVAVAVARWDELTGGLADRLLSAENLVLLWLLFPAVKFAHEIGHGIAVKRWGGEVHDLGIMLLVLTPVPYVDASAATVFRSKWQRGVVGAAGMLVEMLLAAVALLLWSVMEPGLARAVMFNVVVIGSVSTIVFNANPLLRFDGYYILSDLIEIPNLQVRANRFLGQWAKGRLLGMRVPVDGSVTRREKVWLAGYGILSFLYRVLVAFTIAAFIAGRFFVIGLLLAAWALVAMIVWPLVKSMRSLHAELERSPRPAPVRWRLAALVSGLAALLFVVPVPFHTVAEGVTSPPDGSRVQPVTGGFVTRVLVRPGVPLQSGEPVATLTDPELERKYAVAVGRLRELEATYRAERLGSLARAQAIAEEITGLQGEIDRLSALREGLTLRSPRAGRFVAGPLDDLTGRFLQRGETIGYVLGTERPRVQVAVDQADVDLVRSRTRTATTRLSSDVTREVPARLLREVPSASPELPSPALLERGGGRIASDPLADGHATAFDRYFQFELQLETDDSGQRIGERVHVRFDHGWSPLAFQAYRSVRRVFLRLLNV